MIIAGGKTYLEADPRPIQVGQRLCYPELEARIARLPRLGPSMVMRDAKRGADGLYSFDNARQHVQNARKAARLRRKGRAR